jgi:ribonuclease P/MRP protein subunit POP3
VANTASSPTRSTAVPEDSAQDSPQDTTSPYAMVFVARGDQTSTFNCHFPKMVAASCAKSQVDDRTRLVGFSKPSSERLSRCLNVARVSSVAVRRDAPGTGPLWDFVKQRVKPIEALWLGAETSGSYKGAKINSMETTVGPKKIRLS